MRARDSQRHTRRRRAAVFLLPAALLASACGPVGSTAGGTTPPEPTPDVTPDAQRRDAAARPTVPTEDAARTADSSLDDVRAAPVTDVPRDQPAAPDARDTAVDTRDPDARSAETDARGVDARPATVPAPAGLIPAFIALGHGARTTISCDDGRSWVADQTVAQSNDDHGPYSAHGVAWGDGAFLALVGWGNPSIVRRSEDGVKWETVPRSPPSGSYADLVFGRGAFVIGGGHRARRSTDRGSTWTAEASQGSGGHLRRMAFGDHGEKGTIVAAGDGRIVYSPDNGLTWKPAQAGAGDCVKGFYMYGGVAYGGGVFVVAQESGAVCSSTDGGATWTQARLPSAFQSNVVWTGSEFMVWAPGKAYVSANGTAWTQKRLNVGHSPGLVAVAVGGTGTFVGVAGDGRRFHRSADGLEWTALPASAHGTGTTIWRVASGFVKPSALCPPR